MIEVIIMNYIGRSTKLDSKSTNSPTGDGSSIDSFVSRYKPKHRFMAALALGATLLTSYGCGWGNNDVEERPTVEQSVQQELDESGGVGSPITPVPLQPSASDTPRLASGDVAPNIVEDPNTILSPPSEKAPNPITAPVPVLTQPDASGTPRLASGNTVPVPVLTQPDASGTPRLASGNDPAEPSATTTPAPVLTQPNASGTPPLAPSTAPAVNLNLFADGFESSGLDGWSSYENSSNSTTSSTTPRSILSVPLQLDLLPLKDLDPIDLTTLDTITSSMTSQNYTLNLDLDKSLKLSNGSTFDDMFTFKDGKLEYKSDFQSNFTLEPFTLDLDTTTNTINAPDTYSPSNGIGMTQYFRTLFKEAGFERAEFEKWVVPSIIATTKANESLQNGPDYLSVVRHGDGAGEWKGSIDDPCPDGLPEWRAGETYNIVVVTDQDGPVVSYTGMRNTAKTATPCLEDVVAPTPNAPTTRTPSTPNPYVPSTDGPTCGPDDAPQDDGLLLVIPHLEQNYTPMEPTVPANSNQAPEPQNTPAPDGNSAKTTSAPSQSSEDGNWTVGLRSGTGSFNRSSTMTFDTPDGVQILQSDAAYDTTPAQLNIEYQDPTTRIEFGASSTTGTEKGSDDWLGLNYTPAGIDAQTFFVEGEQNVLGGAKGGLDVIAGAQLTQIEENDGFGNVYSAQDNASFKLGLQGRYGPLNGDNVRTGFGLVAQEVDEIHPLYSQIDVDSHWEATPQFHFGMQEGFGEDDGSPNRGGRLNLLAGLNEPVWTNDDVEQLKEGWNASLRGEYGVKFGERFEAGLWGSATYDQSRFEPSNLLDLTGAEPISPQFDDWTFLEDDTHSLNWGAGIYGKWAPRFLNPE